jgi:predicted alpha-1,6-mannanase (GH76 family)
VINRPPKVTKNMGQKATKVLYDDLDFQAFAIGKGYKTRQDIQNRSIQSKRKIIRGFRNAQKVGALPFGIDREDREGF